MPREPQLDDFTHLSSLIKDYHFYLKSHSIDTNDERVKRSLTEVKLGIKKELGRLFNLTETDDIDKLFKKVERKSNIDTAVFSGFWGRCHDADGSFNESTFFNGFPPAIIDRVLEKINLISRSDMHTDHRRVEVAEGLRRAREELARTTQPDPVAQPSSRSNRRVRRSVRRRVQRPARGSSKKPHEKRKSYKHIQLGKNGCCCGATLRTPCVCMMTGEQCSSKGRLCSCFRLLHNQTKK